MNAPVTILLMVFLMMMMTSEAAVKPPDDDLHGHVDFNGVLHDWRRNNAQHKPRTMTPLQQVMSEIQKEADKQFGVVHDDSAPIPDELFEGDIRLTLEQAQAMLRRMRDSDRDRNRPRRRRVKRKMSTSFVKMWNLPVGFIFDGTHDKYERETIRKALNLWSSETCVNFRESFGAISKLVFTKGQGCWSFIGYTKQKNQSISIGNDCLSVGSISHEVGHALGLYHEQSRPDRDRHVRIEKNNIRSGRMYNFVKETWDDINTFQVPYDLGSIMHYGSQFYAKKNDFMNLSTVVPRDKLMRRVIGQRQQLSFLDVKIINKAYCRATCNKFPRLKCLREGYQDPRNCRRCKCPEGYSGRLCERIHEGSVQGGCGGYIRNTRNDHTGFIESPRYGRGYMFDDIKCTWFIKAPYGHRIALRIMPRFGITCHKDMCTDYLEIRSNSSMTMTGYRLCCDDPPLETIYSKTNEMMLLFRTYVQSQQCTDSKSPEKCMSLNTGFRARYSFVKCGGCLTSNEQTEHPCTYQIKTTCTFSGSSCSQEFGVSKECNSVRHKLVSRYCYVDKNYCCSGYTLMNVKCIRNDIFKIMKKKAMKKRKLMKQLKLEKKLLRKRQREKKQWRLMRLRKKQKKQKISRRRTWTKWSKWTKCEGKCGGNNRIKVKRCLKPKVCGKRVDIKEKRCNIKPCYRSCSKLIKYNCGRRKRCTRFISTLCWPYCNLGFELNRYSGECNQFNTAIYKE